MRIQVIEQTERQEIREDFFEWMQDGNTVAIAPNKYLEQTTQWRKEFTLHQLYRFFLKEYINI